MRLEVKAKKVAITAAHSGGGGEGGSYTAGKAVAAR